MADVNTNPEVNNNEATPSVETAPKADTTPKTEPKQEEAPEEITYTKQEVESKISRAVNDALTKARKDSSKTTEDLSRELADLKAELARKENEAFVSNEINSRNIPSELTSLFYDVDNDASKAKLNAFSKWYKDAIQTAVDAKLNATTPPAFHASEVGGKKPVGGFLDYYKTHDK